MTSSERLEGEPGAVQRLEADRRYGGLAIVCRLAELHGGTAAVISDGPGHGRSIRVFSRHAPSRPPTFSLLHTSV